MELDDLPMHRLVLREHTERVDDLIADATRLRRCGLLVEGLRSLLDAEAILGEYTDGDLRLIQDV